MPLIMIVDDQPEAGLLLKTVLRRAGFAEVDVVTDARAAIEACMRAVPDVLITDLRMPGMSGLELLETLHAVLPPESLPSTVVVSGDDEPGALQQARDYGVARFFLKPIDIRELNRCVAELIAGRSRAA